MNYAALPDSLPEKPTGWTRQMLMHLNFGGAGGAASYEVKNQSGETMPIGYQYDTRKGGFSGFTLPGVKTCMSWDELREIWPRWIARARAKQAAAK
jgi:hypothetical protein